MRLMSVNTERIRAERPHQVPEPLLLAGCDLDSPGESTRNRSTTSPARTSIPGWRNPSRTRVPSRKVPFVLPRSARTYVPPSSRISKWARGHGDVADDDVRLGAFPHHRARTGELEFLPGIGALLQNQSAVALGQGRQIARVYDACPHWSCAAGGHRGYSEGRGHRLSTAQTGWPQRLWNATRACYSAEDAGGIGAIRPLQAASAHRGRRHGRGSTSPAWWWPRESSACSSSSGSSPISPATASSSNVSWTRRGSRAAPDPRGHHRRVRLRQGGGRLLHRHGVRARHEPGGCHRARSCQRGGLSHRHRPCTSRLRSLQRWTTPIAQPVPTVASGRWCTGMCRHRTCFCPSAVA